MGVEKDHGRGRIRYRFDVKEIEKYAGKDVPHTVIKRWIEHGRLFETSLSALEESIKELPTNRNISDLSRQIEELQETQNHVRKLLESLTEVFINLSRVLLISSTIQSRNLTSLSEPDRHLIKRFDQAFNHISSELFPEIRNDIFFKILVKGNEP